MLGVWWRKLTWIGAAAGILVGGGLVLTAIVISTISSLTGGWAPGVVTQPALITVPIAFLTVILISKMTPQKIPSDVAQVRLRMHAPDGLGLTRDRAIASFGTAEERSRLADGRHRK
jgi:Na+(H+)/acetate symporter ActP